jgi:two-component sensor histidine kinase
MRWLTKTQKPPRVLHDARLTAVNFIADAVNRTLDLREITENALHAVLAVTRLDGGAMFRWQAEEGILRLFAARGLSEAFTRQVTTIRRGDDPRVDAVLAGDPQVTVDFSVGPATAGFRSALLSPIRASGEVMGVLAIGSYRGRRFEREAVELIEVVASQIGIAITKAELLDDLARKNQLLELLVEEAHHRIKNNLQMISGLLQLGITPATDRASAERLQHAIAQIQAIAQVHNLLSEETPEQVDAHTLLTAIIDALVQALPGDEAPPVLDVAVEQVWLSAAQAVPLALIVNELVANSLLHGHPPPDQPLVVTVRCQARQGRVTLLVTDNGGGVPLTAPVGGDPGQGMDIVRQLAEVNLRGQLRLRNDAAGLRAELEFSGGALDIDGGPPKMPAPQQGR